MQCPNCQRENPEDARFCNGCGYKLDLACPDCGNVNPPGSRFCNGCGYDLRMSLEATPVDYSEPQSYTPKYLADKILTTRSSIEGERKLVTVFFADVANYTAMSEKLDPEEVHQIMDGCFKILMDEIHKYEGTINQFTGDGVMALFGAPVAHEDHAQRACYAALSVQTALGEYGKKIKKETGIDFQMRIGINSGHVIVGSIGDDLRMDYTATGDTTNLAARMESAASSGNVLVTKDTYRLVKDFFEFSTPLKIELKGKEEPQEAYELIGTGEIDTRFRASVAKGLTPFVGRKNSLPALLEVYEKAKAGSGQVIGIVGEAGVGKSRLHLEFRNRILEDDFIYLEGRCIHFGNSMAYLPILDILRYYFEITDEDRENLVKRKIEDKVLSLDEKLNDVIPPFQDLLSLKVDDEEFIKFEPQQRREKTFEALRDLLIRLSQDKTLIIVIEDLHWIDKTTEEVIDYFIGWIASSPILLILLYRPEYTHQWGSKSYYNRIGLDQLTTKSSAELVQAVLEEGEVAPDLRELILSRAAGNPLFMEELTHTLLENGSIEKRDKQYVLSSRASETQIPDTVQGIIAARMDRLEDSLKRTMQVASVIGREFAFRILQAITEMREELKSYLLSLQGLEFIYEKALFPELEYIFKHALTQEVAYNSLLRKRRKEIHENIGGAIEEIFQDRLEEFYEMLAYHYSKSDNLNKAYQYLKLSGEKATGNYANWETINLYKQALAVLNQLPKTEDNKQKQIEVHVLMAGTFLILGFPEDALPILLEGERLTIEVGDEKNLTFFYSYLLTFHSLNGNTLMGEKYAEKCLIQASKVNDVDLMVISSLALAWNYFYQGRYIEVVESSSKVIDHLEVTGNKLDYNVPFNAYSFLCAVCGFTLGGLGNFDHGEKLFEKALGNATEIGDFITLALCEGFHALFFFFRGDGRKCIEHAQKAIKYNEDADFQWVLGSAWLWSGAGYYLIGELRTAEDHMKKGLKIHIDSNVDPILPFYYWCLCMVYCDACDYNKAQNHAETAQELSLKTNERSIEGISKVWKGRILGKKDASQVNKLEDTIMQGIQILDELTIKPLISQSYFFLSELYADAGQKEKAMESLKKAEAEFKDMGMDYWLGRTYVVYADLYKKGGETSKAKENLNKAIEFLKKCGADGWAEKYEKELAGLS